MRPKSRSQAAAALHRAYALYLGWQHAEVEANGEEECADEQTFLDWVSDEVEAQSSYCCPDCSPRSRVVPPKPTEADEIRALSKRLDKEHVAEAIERLHEATGYAARLLAGADASGEVHEEVTKLIEQIGTALANLHPLSPAEVTS